MLPFIIDDVGGREDVTTIRYCRPRRSTIFSNIILLLFPDGQAERIAGIVALAPGAH